MDRCADIDIALGKDRAGVGVGENLPLFPICISTPLHAPHFRNFGRLVLKIPGRRLGALAE